METVDLYPPEPPTVIAPNPFEQKPTTLVQYSDRPRYAYASAETILGSGVSKIEVAAAGAGKIEDPPKMGVSEIAEIILKEPQIIPQFHVVAAARDEIDGPPWFGSRPPPHLARNLAEAALFDGAVLGGAQEDGPAAPQLGPPRLVGLQGLGNDQPAGKDHRPPAPADLPPMDIDEVPEAPRRGRAMGATGAAVAPPQPPPVPAAAVRPPPPPYVHPPPYQEEPPAPAQPAAAAALAPQVAPVEAPQALPMDVDRQGRPRARLADHQARVPERRALDEEDDDGPARQRRRVDDLPPVLARPEPPPRQRPVPPPRQRPPPPPSKQAVKRPGDPDAPLPPPRRLRTDAGPSAPAPSAAAAAAPVPPPRQIRRTLEEMYGDAIPPGDPRAAQRQRVTGRRPPPPPIEMPQAPRVSKPYELRSAQPPPVPPKPDRLRPGAVQPPPPIPPPRQVRRTLEEMYGDDVPPGDPRAAQRQRVTGRRPPPPPIQIPPPMTVNDLQAAAAARAAQMMEGGGNLDQEIDSLMAPQAGGPVRSSRRRPTPDVDADHMPLDVTRFRRQLESALEKSRNNRADHERIRRILDNLARNNSRVSRAMQREADFFINKYSRR